MKSHGEVKRIKGKRVASPEYRSWQMMKNRCLNSNADDYAYYGERGIRVCDDWLFFELFLEDMGRRPTKLHTLDRIDSNGHYSKANCRWATRQQQAQNRTYCVGSLEIAEEIRRAYAAGEGPQYELAKRFGLTQSAVSQITRGLIWTNAEGPLLSQATLYRDEGKGENNANAKISDKEAKIIRITYASGRITQKELGEKFGLSQSQISKIILGDSHA